MNDENLKKGEATRFKSGEKAAEAGRKGGIASGESKRLQKDIQKAFRAIFEAEIPSGKAKEALEALELPPDMFNGMLYGITRRAIQGDPRAFDLVMKYSGHDRLREAEIAERTRDSNSEDKAAYEQMMKALNGSAESDWSGEDV